MHRDTKRLNISHLPSKLKCDITPIGVLSFHGHTPTWSPVSLFLQLLLELATPPSPHSLLSRTVRSQRQESPWSSRPLLLAPFCHIQLTICQSLGSLSRPTVQLPTQYCSSPPPPPIHTRPLSLGHRVRM